MHHLLVVYRGTLLHLFIYWDGEMLVLIMDDFEYKVQATTTTITRARSHLDDGKSFYCISFLLIYLINVMMKFWFNELHPLFNKYWCDDVLTRLGQTKEK